MDGKLISDPKVYQQVAGWLKSRFVGIHAIYSPGNNASEPEWYLAAVDLFEPGQTYKVYFTLDEKRGIRVKLLERWYFG